MKQLKLDLIEKVFPSVQKLTLNHLDKHQMNTERKQLVRDVQVLIASKTQLVEMTIRSAHCKSIQESAEIKIIVADATILTSLKAKGWSVYALSTDNGDNGDDFVSSAWCILSSAFVMEPACNAWACSNCSQSHFAQLRSTSKRDNIWCDVTVCCLERDHSVFREEC